MVNSAVSGYMCDSSSSSAVSPAQPYFYHSFLTQIQANTTPWSCLDTAGLVPETVSLLKHLHSSHLPAYTHLPDAQEVGSFTASCAGQRVYLIYCQVGGTEV